MPMNKPTLFLLAGLTACATPADVAHAQTAKYPSRTITFVVPLAAGSTTDVAARLIAQRVSLTLGANIIIENKPGASTMLGSSTVAKAPPDGHTLLMGASALTVNQNLFKTVPYETEKDFAPVSLLVTAPLVLVVNPKLEVRTLREFLAKYKDATDLSFASGGAGTMLHLAGEVLAARSGVAMRHVPYRGGGPALTDVVAGHVQLMFATPLIKSNIDSGDVRALAVTGPKRVDTLPDVPTFAEAGFPLPEVDNGAWFGLLAPAGTPREIVQRLNQEFNAALRDPEVQKGLVRLGLEAKGTTPEEFARFIRDEIKRWPPIFTRAGITPQ
jgi:tripartite-type tricarboxylate transporter receptor subunit TctC